MSQESSGESPAKGRAQRFLFLLSLVAVLFVAGWLLLRAREGTPPRPPASSSVLLSVKISSDPKAEAPGANPSRFRSGQEVYLHFALEKPCSVFVGMLDASLALTAMSPAATDCPVGPSTLGPFEVEDGSGHEAMILIASEKAQSAVDFQRLLGRASDAARGVEPKFGAKLPIILTALRAHEGVAAEPVEYEHAR